MIMQKVLIFFSIKPCKVMQKRVLCGELMGVYEFADGCYMYACRVGILACTVGLLIFHFSVPAALIDCWITAITPVCQPWRIVVICKCC